MSFSSSPPSFMFIIDASGLSSLMRVVLACRHIPACSDLSILGRVPGIDWNHRMRLCCYQEHSLRHTHGYVTESKAPPPSSSTSVFCT